VKHGELGKECAPAYYAYANCLIRKAEESMDVFGDAVDAAEKEKSGILFPTDPPKLSFFLPVASNS